MNLPPFEPVFPTTLIIGVAATVGVLTLLRAVFGKPLRPSWFQAPVLLLRIAAIVLVAFFLLNPSDPIIVNALDTRSLILLDESASMSLGSPTRWDESKQWVSSFREAMNKAGLQPPSLSTFASTVEPVADLETRKPTGTETRLAGAIEKAVVGAGITAPDHIIVVSDGRTQDRRSLPASLAQARARGTGISTLAIGADTPPRNAGIAAVSAPRVVRSNSRVNVHVEIAASGFQSSELISLILKDENGVRVGGAELPAPTSGKGSAECVLSFNSGVRTARYTLELPPDARDVAPDDNHFDFTVEVAASKLRVLFVEGTHVKRSVGTTGHWLNDMELMTRAWDATGEIEYECLTPISEYLNSPNLVGVSFANGEMIPDKSKTFPRTREELYRFDVMLISDVPVGNFSKEQMEWVVDWVTERGGGFLMGGGYTSFDVGNYDQTPWERITPVDMLAFGDGFNEQRFKIEIPKSVRNHPTWRMAPEPEANDAILATHPDFTGMNRVRRAKPGALVLMTRPSMNNEPVIAAQQYGRGRSIAYLGDPNGGWAKFLVGWGPPGGPPQGPHTELGHGDRFRVNLAATKAASGPMPPHPSPYYAQYWVNVVKWLGENSIRWRRDKLAGNVSLTQAQPGHALPVAAEVLAVTNRDALLALNVGARLDRPGSPRIRLEYDRDRREFVGAIPIPTDFTGGEVAVLFDTVVGGDSLTDAARVGVRRENREFTDSAPDRTFLADLAQAGGGRVIKTVEDAVAVCREAAAKRAQESQRTWTQPAWTRWPWLIALVAVLCVEWALRRRGTTNAAIATAAVLVCVVPIQAQDAVQSAPVDVKALIEQLGAPRVRLRDEAEEKLKTIPEALEAAKAAAKDSPNPEVRLRARNVAQTIRQNLWQQEAVAEGHRTQPTSWARNIIISPDGKRLYTRGEDHVRAWDAQTFQPGITFGARLGMWRDWQRGGPIWTLAVSPDSKRVVSTDDTGNITVHNAENGSTLVKIANRDPSNPNPGVLNYRVLWAASFFPDGKSFVTVDRGGNMRIWDTESGDLKQSITMMQSQVSRSVTVSPNGKFIACAIDYGGEPDYVWVWNVEQATWTHQQPTTNRMNALEFSRDNGRLMGANFDGFVHVWKVGDNGALSDEQRIGPIGGRTCYAIFSSDNQSIFAVTDGGDGHVSQWDAKTGEELWRGPSVEGGLYGIAVLGPDRFVTTGFDDRVRLWQRRVLRITK